MKYFTLSEFSSPDIPGSGTLMEPDFLDMLDKARELAGVPFKINSGYRSAAHNKKVGGVARSSHLKGCAADISAPGSALKFQIVQAALRVGFNRIGVGATFVHLDIDKDKTPNLMWTYG